MLYNREIFKDFLKIKLGESWEGICSQYFQWFLKYRFDFKLFGGEVLNFIFQGLI